MAEATENAVNEMAAQQDAAVVLDDKVAKEVDKNGANEEPAMIIQLSLFAVSALEGLDTQLIPVCLFALQRDIKLTLSHVAILTTVQMVLTNLAAPFWGILADRGTLQRRKILMIGALGEGLAVTTLAFAPNFVPMIISRALSGFFLASLRPVCNGLIADMTSDNSRGKLFGRMQAALLAGMFFSSIIGGNIANKKLAGIPGWRLLFITAGVCACIIATAVARFLREPPRIIDEASQKKGCKAVGEELLTVAHFLTIPTFCVMIMQGIFGTIPWSVMGNALLYFKLCGLEDFEASILTSEGTVMGIFGNLLGGMVADALAARLGYHGRPLSAQITVAIGIPLVYMQFYGIPAGDGTFAMYFAIIAGFGVLGSWAQSGTNFPILSDIVPPQDRSKVMAWECALENSVANAIGPVFVAFLAESCFGYKFGTQEDNGESLESATALGKAMAVTICIPWCVTLVAYTLLHWSYPRDMRRLLAKSASSEIEGVTTVSV